MNFIPIEGPPVRKFRYILKSFLARIGLSPAHPQLRIVTTSASLEEVPSESNRDAKFLSDFFGTPTEDGARFRVISGPRVPHQTGHIPKLSRFAQILADFATSSDDADAFSEVVRRLRHGYASGPAPVSAGDLLNDLRVEDALKELAELKRMRLGDVSLGTPPLTVLDIANGVFDGHVDSARGLLELMTSERHDLDGFRGKLRMHVFIKNLTGLARSMHAPDGRLGDPLLYEKGRSICP